MKIPPTVNITYARGGRAKIQGPPHDSTFPLRRAENGR